MRYVFFYVVVGLIFNGVSLAMEQPQYEGAIKLASELLEKIKGESPVSLKEGNKFFGPVGQVPSLNVFLLEKLGYLNNYGTPVKKLPKYSPIGELLRMNKSLILPDGSYNEISFFPANRWSKNKKQVFQRNSKETIYVFVRMRMHINEISNQNERIICLEYNVEGKFFSDLSITVNGKSILSELGFSISDGKYGYPIIEITGDALTKIKQKM